MATRDLSAVINLRFSAGKCCDAGFGDWIVPFNGIDRSTVGWTPQQLVNAFSDGELPSS